MSVAKKKVLLNRRKRGVLVATGAMTDGLVACRRAAAAGEDAGCRIIRCSAEWSFGDAGTVVLSFSSMHIVMLDGVLRVAVVECSMHSADCGEAVVPVASGAARGSYSMEPWPWWIAEHSQALVLVRLYAW
jgi:hypothetical protein